MSLAVARDARLMAGRTIRGRPRPAWLRSAARPGGSMDLPYRIPGAPGPDIIVRRPSFGNVQVLVDGVPVEGHRGSFPIQLPDGTAKELRLTGQWMGLKAVV